jgi:hypothetical protein
MCNEIPIQNAVQTLVQFEKKEGRGVEKVGKKDKVHKNRKPDRQKS